MARQEEALRVDVAVFGGGVAGLWLLGRLRAEGFRAILLETNGLGGGQTRYAQGIIHGGTKYALTGEVGESARAVAAMPTVWRDCLAGEGELDLRGVRILSPHQYLWSTSALTSRMAGFFASRLMRSRTDALVPEEQPPLFRHPDFKGRVYRLDEPVLDTASLTDALAAPHREALLKVSWPDGMRITRDGRGWQVHLNRDGERLLFSAGHLVFAAGRGNGELLAAIGRSRPAMQLRPLQMVMVRGTLPPNVYAHCLGASTNPRITISTHFDCRGSTVWYLGGQLAEEGVGRTPEGQIAAAKGELLALLPWVPQTDLQWCALEIERAESRQPDGGRPDGPFAELDDGIVTAWPTKLALAPKLAAEVLALLRRAGASPGSGGAVRVPATWPRPELAPLPWQEESRWS